MGTLFDQPERSHHDHIDGESTFHKIKKLRDDLGVSFEIAMDLYKLALEERKLAIMVADGDIKDEQLAGFGDLLSDINRNLSKTAEALEDWRKEW